MLPLARSINALSTSVRARRTLESASGQYSLRLKRICLRSRGLGSSFEWVHLSIYSNRTSARPLRTRVFAAKLHVFARRKCDGADSVPRALRGVAVTIAVNGGIDWACGVAVRPGDRLLCATCLDRVSGEEAEHARAEIPDEMRPKVDQAFYSVLGRSVRRIHYCEFERVNIQLCVEGPSRSNGTSEEGSPERDTLALDFYDGTRVAT